MKTKPQIEKLHLKITQASIDRGVAKDSRQCIIGDTIHQKIPKARYISVLMNKIKFTVGKVRYIFDTPTKAANSLLDFDAGERESIKPFSITLKDPKCVKAGLRKNFVRKPIKKAKKRHEYPKKVVREFGLNRWHEALDTAGSNRRGVLA